MVRRWGPLVAGWLAIGCTPEPSTSVDANSNDVFEDDPRPPGPAPGPDPTPAERLVSSIDRTVDSAYVYPYEQARFVPPDGSTLLIMGQTVSGIENYVESYSDRPDPAGWSAYWGIPEFKGITEAHTSDIGVTHDHQWLVDTFPHTVLNSGLWMVGTWGVAQNTADGEYDAVVDQFSTWAKEIERPIYLRIGYEFDGPHNELPPDVYVAAYRRIVDRMRANGVENVAFVWHSYAAPPYNNHPLAEWYPGDDYVDWVGISVFFQPYGSATPGPSGQVVVDFARTHAKPVMIAESSPVLGLEPTGTEDWTWFANFFSLTYRYNIKAIAFIHEDWRRVSNLPGLESWDDARLNVNPEIADGWFEETKRDRYLKASPNLFGTLGYDPTAL